jgi:transposase
MRVQEACHRERLRAAIDCPHVRAVGGAKTVPSPRSRSKHHDRLAPERARLWLGRERWVVERTIAWLHQHRRVRIRYERRAHMHEAFLHLACSRICLKQLGG